MKTTRLLIPLFSLLVTMQAAYAYYCPDTQRWLNRDPAEDLIIFENVYEGNGIAINGDAFAFTMNNPISLVDLFGLDGRLHSRQEYLVVLPHNFHGGMLGYLLIL